MAEYVTNFNWKSYLILSHCYHKHICRIFFFFCKDNDGLVTEAEVNWDPEVVCSKAGFPKDHL